MSMEKKSAEPDRTHREPWSVGNKYFFDFLRLVRVGPRSSWWGEPVSALAGAAGGAWLGHDCTLPMEPVVRVAAALFGVIIGSVLAALAMITRACDTAFLKKAKKAGILPISEYLWPFFTTIALGVLSAVSLLVVSAIPVDASTDLRMALGALTGFLVFWTLASLLPALGALVVFTRLIERAAEIES